MSVALSLSTFEDLSDGSHALAHGFDRDLADRARDKFALTVLVVDESTDALDTNVGNVSMILHTLPICGWSIANKRRMHHLWKTYVTDG